MWLGGYSLVEGLLFTEKGQDLSPGNTYAQYVSLLFVSINVCACVYAKKHWLKTQQPEKSSQFNVVYSQEYLN